MTAPDRPTREQVDADLAEADVRQGPAWEARARLAAEVRALRAEQEAALVALNADGPLVSAAKFVREAADAFAARAALVARTPQLPEFPVYRCDQSRHPVVPCSRCELVTAAPLPAVPDGPTPEAYAAASRALDVWHKRRHEALRLLRDYDTAKALRTVDVWVEQIVGVLDAPVPDVPDAAELTVSQVQAALRRAGMRLEVEVSAVPDGEDGREKVYSNLLRTLARRHGALRRAYNGTSIDPWENPEYCNNASAASPCGPALRMVGLCVDCTFHELGRLNAQLAVAEQINTLPADEQVVERVARKLHETSEMRLFTWERAGASRRHGHWHDTMRERARSILAVAAVGGEDLPARLDAAAEALDPFAPTDAHRIRDLAEWMRTGPNGVEVRAAVAAALARPTRASRPSSSLQEGETNG